jgi:Holliday junction resolvase-like predicted endonuclease
VKSSEAEVDFVIARNGVITPVEVKAGKTGSLRSARLFMKEKGRRLAVRISQHGLSLHDGILSVPFYMCSEIPRLLDEAEHF